MLISESSSRIVICRIRPVHRCCYCCCYLSIAVAPLRSSYTLLTKLGGRENPGPQAQVADRTRPHGQLTLAARVHGADGEARVIGRLHGRP